MMLFIHLLACFWLFVRQEFEEEVIETIKTAKLINDDSEQGFLDYLNHWAYVKFFNNSYFMLVTLSTVGYGDHRSVFNDDPIDVFSQTCIIFLGLSAFNYLTGRLNIQIQ